MYRGVKFYEDRWNRLSEEQKAFKAVLENAKPGDAISMGQISSFSTDRSEAAYYGSGGKETTSFEIQIEGSHKSISTDELTGMGHKERITEGEFEVVRVEKGKRVRLPPAWQGTAKYQSIIVLRQRGVF